MMASVCVRNCSPPGDQGAERSQEGAKDKITLKDTAPVTYFLQVGPTF
jgi:hypothetical protein